MPRPRPAGNDKVENHSHLADLGHGREVPVPVLRQNFVRRQVIHLSALIRRRSRLNGHSPAPPASTPPELQQLAVDPRRTPDFLWFMSGDFFLRLPQLLPRHRREVVLVVIRCLALPHDEDDLQPLCAQRPERLAMRMSPRPLVVVVCPGPFTRTEREERDMIDYVPQRLVAGEAKLHDALLAAPLRQGHGSSLRLEMPKRLPPL